MKVYKREKNGTISRDRNGNVVFIEVASGCEHNPKATTARGKRRAEKRGK